MGEIAQLAPLKLKRGQPYSKVWWLKYWTVDTSQVKQIQHDYKDIRKGTEAVGDEGGILKVPYIYTILGSQKKKEPVWSERD